VNRWLRTIFTISLVSLLAACSVSQGVPDAWLKKAISLQMQQVQQELSQQLRLTAPQVKVDRVRVTAQNPVTIQDIPGLQVKGQYDFTLDRPKQKVMQQNYPFEVYLQRQKKAWRLAQQKSTGQGIDWVTQEIQ
jgi:hypothetical protein